MIVKTKDGPSRKVRGLLGAVTAIISGAAVSQGRPGVDSSLEEIIVTAQKRAESLKDVPISVTAIGSEEIEALRVRGVKDFFLEIPNATYTSFGAFGDSISLRGINAFSGGLFAPIALTVDDLGTSVTSTRSSLLSAQFLDLERVEVLRGPQGVLSGRNALGGAINMITVKPNSDGVELNGTVDYGRYATRFLKGVVNVPLGDRAAVRAVAYTENGDGAVRNVGPSGGRSSTDSFGGRLAIRWRPTDSLTLDASYSYEDQDLGFATSLRRDNFISPEDRAATIAELEEWGGDFDDIDFFEEVGTNGGTVRNDVDEMLTYVTRIVSLGASYEWINHTLDIKYSHYSQENRIVFDWDKTEFNWFRGDWRLPDVSSDSAELKLSSQYDGAFNWLAGLSYHEEEYRFSFADFIGDWADGANGGIPSFAGDYRLFDVGDDRTFLESLGIFANGFWDLAERWHLSVGGRISVEKVRSGSFFIEDDPSDPRFFVGSAVTATDFGETAEITEFSPRVTVNYDLNKSVTSYVQYATGYRAGYGNSVRATELGFQSEVQPETVTNYEVGFKGNVFDNHLSFAVALFYMDYENLQVTLTTGDPGSNPTDPIPFTYDSNAGNSVSQGIELEGTWLVNERLKIGGGVAYTDATLDQFTIDALDDADSVTFRDVPVLGIRPWTGKLNVAYEQPVTATLMGMARLNWHYQDSAYTEGLVESESGIFFVPAFDTLDISVGVANGDRWRLLAYADNVLDEDYFMSTQFEAGTSRRGGFVNFIPRTYGLRFTVNVNN